MNDLPVEVQSELVASPNAVAVRSPESEVSKPAITPAQAKVEAVAHLTMAAYSKAASLSLTAEESAALAADFPDEAFKAGAGGKENLIYIEHAFLRDRLTQVFGVGQWAIIPRNRWAEPFRTQKNVEGQRVYVEAMLVVRGCFVGEAVGAMEYYPSNAGQDYSDAVEGAKTAALRRCAKELGIGLQAWKKDWCDGWWARKRGHSTAGPSRHSPPPPKNPASAPPEAKAPPIQPPTEATRARMIAELCKNESDRASVTEFFQKADVPGSDNTNPLMSNETLESLPLRYVPATKGQMRDLIAAITAFARDGERAMLPYPPNPEPEASKASKAAKPAKAAPKPSKPVEVPRDAILDYNAPDAPWRSFPMPWGKQAGTPLAELDKKYLFGLWANYVVETEYNGKPKKPETIAKDQQFRDMLDEAGKHYEFVRKDEPKSNDEPEAEEVEDDVPF